MTDRTEELKKMMRLIVQALLALSGMGAVIVLTFQGKMEPAVLAGLVGMSVSFFVAEMKNGEDRKHSEEMQRLRNDAPQ